jgi:cyclohexyl-isocyanide hydratase
VFDRNRVTGGCVTAGIDFALALMVAIEGEDHARTVQLGLEYDPHPPFNSDTPDKAGEQLVQRVQNRTNRMAPDRKERIRTVAEGFKSR